MQTCTIICMFLLFATPCAFAQEDGYIRYTREQGLSNNYISGIEQDSLGYIWIATQKGLNRFDGRAFQTLFKNSPQSPVPDNFLSSLHRQGSELTGTTLAGAFAFNPYTRRSKQLIVPCDSVIYFWTNFGYDIVKDYKGHYVVSTKTGLFVFDSNGALINRYDHHLAADAGRTELVFGGWVHPFPGGSVFQQNGLLGSLYHPSQNRIDTLFAQRHPVLKRWLTNSAGEMNIAYPGPGGQLFIINFEKNALDVLDLRTMQGSSHALPFSVQAEVDWHRKLFFLGDSLMVMPCKVGGFYLLHWNKAGQRLYCNNKKYFEGRFCTAVLRDREGRLWIGTNDGLYKQDLRSAFFTDDDLSKLFPRIMNHGIRGIYADSARFFIGLGNSGGLLVLDRPTKQVLRHITLRAYESSSVADIVPVHPDTLWICTGSGILWLNKRNYSHGRIQLQPNWANHSGTLYHLQDAQGNIWLSFGRFNSVLRYNRAQRTFTAITAEQYPLLKLTFVFSMAEDMQGNIWFAGDGLCRWNRAKGVIDTLIPYPPVSRALRNYMYILGRDHRNNLWLSSFDNEVMQFDCNTGRMYLREQEHNWRDGNTVTASPVIDGHIWMGTDNGISAFNIFTHAVRQFTYSNGLPSVAITTYRKRSFYDSTAHRFYIGAGHHLISFTPDASLSKATAPRLFIDRITTRDTVMPYLGQPVRLPHLQRNVTLAFSAVNLTDPEENRFAWRLAGQPQWQELDGQQAITLTGLSPGSHTVQVKLYSINNHWPPQVQDAVIHISPPFWRSGWFMLLAIALAAGLIGLLYRSRIAKEREKARVQQELASINLQLAEAQLSALQTQMNPHFIFNALNSIKRMILDEDTAGASRYLSKFALMIRITLEHSKKGFVTLQETIEYLVAYLEMERLRFGDSFTYTIETGAGLDAYETVIPSLMIQPLVENAIWHGLMPKEGEKKISIRFRREEGNVVCSVEDNGIGIRKSGLRRLRRNGHRSVGLDNLRNRIKIMDEKYEMGFTFEMKDLHETSMNETGTLVVLKFRSVEH